MLAIFLNREILTLLSAVALDSCGAAHSCTSTAQNPEWYSEAALSASFDPIREV